MQHIWDNATAATGFKETHAGSHPELSIGAAYGMPQAVLWVFRSHVFIANASGTPEQIARTFERVPLRALEAEALRREPVADGWIIDAIQVRAVEHSPLKRIVAAGKDGEASILFESPVVDEIGMAALEAATIGSTLRDALEVLSSRAKRVIAGGV